MNGTRVRASQVFFPLILACGAALFLADSSASLAAECGLEGHGCWAFDPCCAGLTCEAGTHKCRAPGGEGDPCHATRPCGEGLTCEAGTHKCRRRGTAGDNCHATRPCAEGYTCEAGSQKCQAPGGEGDSCHATRPCGEGLTCEAGVHKCRLPAELGERCHATHPCGSGLTCHPGIQRCYHSPRWPGEPCSAGYACKAPLRCMPVAHRCFPPEKVQWNLETACRALYSADIARAVRDSGVTWSFGAGAAGGAGSAAGSFEIGLVYGVADGQDKYGCYRALCGGVTSSDGDPSLSPFGALSFYNQWSDFAGDSQVVSVSVTTGTPIPFLGLGFTFGEASNLQGSKIGTALAVSAEAGGNLPVEVGVGNLLCNTQVKEINLESSAMLEAQSIDAWAFCEATLHGKFNYYRNREAACPEAISHAVVDAIAEGACPGNRQDPWGSRASPLYAGVEASWCEEVCRRDLEASLAWYRDNQPNESCLALLKNAIHGTVQAGSCLGNPEDPRDVYWSAPDQPRYSELRAQRCPEIKFTVQTSHSALCAGSSPASVEYTGSLCSNDGRILWQGMRALNPRSGLSAAQCTWTRGTDATWNAAWVGGCGVAPTNVPDLPVVTATARHDLVGLCAPIEKPVTFSRYADEGTTETRFFGKLCPNPNVTPLSTQEYLAYQATGKEWPPVNAIRWDAMTTLNPRQGIAPDQCTWKRGGDGGWNAQWVGECGKAPTNLPNLPVGVAD